VWRVEIEVGVVYGELGFHDDMLVHDGKFYGDFEICGGHDPE
jgi:hypothetical protein